MVIYSNSIKGVLSRIYLEGIARNGEAPSIYWDAKEALENLDKTCLTVYSKSDAYCPLGWRRNNYPLLRVGYLRFSYTKEQLDNGEILIKVEEVADSNGNIMTENNTTNTNRNMNNKKVVRLTESQLHNIIAESVERILMEMDWKTKYNAGRKEQDLFDKFTQGERNFTDREQKRLKRRGKELGGLGYDYEYNKKSPFLDAAETDFETQFGDEF